MYQQMMAAPGPHAGDLIDGFYRDYVPAYGCAREGCSAGGWAFAAATSIPIGRVAGWLGEGAEGIYDFARPLLKGCGCFVAGTLVETDHGLKPIETIKVGDLVRSRDETTGATTYEHVTALLRPHDREIYEVRLKQAGSGLIETFDVTDDHPWMSKDGQWLTTLQLKAGTRLRTEHGQGVSVVSIKDTGRTADTYNLEVEGTHTFFVGKEHVWVHNACPLMVASNFRANLARLTGLIPAGADAHHVFPQAFEGTFARAGLNIHDPQFGAWWEAVAHRANAATYNQLWSDFLTTGQRSSDEILQFGRSLGQHFGFKVGF